MSLFRMLASHFFGRFFDNEIVSQTGDMRTNVVQALGLLAVPGMFVSFYMLPQRVRFRDPFAQHWLLITDYYFFVIYSMIVMGFVMVLEWDAIFPDRRDYLFLTPLPVGPGSIFTAKSAALGLFLAAFLLDTNLLCTVLGTAVSAGENTPVSLFPRLVVAHASAVLSAGLFVALVFAGLQGLLINLLTGRAFRRVSPWVQMASMGGLILIFFLTPLVCGTIPPAFESHSPLLRWFPPFWFLAMYMDLLPGQPGGAMFHEPAMMARQGLGWAAALFAVFYLAGYRRHTRRVLESLETAGKGPGGLRRAFDAAVNRWLLPHPLERATFHFINQTILRSARHRLFLATVAGVALAVSLPGLWRVRGSPSGVEAVFAPGGLMVAPLMLSFFAVSGLRAAFNLPAELRANWIFQVCECEEQVRHIRAARKWVVSMGLAPLLLALAPFEIWFRGWRMALLHFGFALALSLLLLNLLLVWFRKIPFTCSYFPGKTSMAGMALVYVIGFATYVITMGRLQARLIAWPPGLIVFFAVIGAALWGLGWLERRELGVDAVTLYEDQPEPVVRSLELG